MADPQKFYGVLHIVCFVLFLIGFSSPYWVNLDDDEVTAIVGLWSMCASTDAGVWRCATVNPEIFKDASMYHGAQAALCLALIAYVVVIFLFLAQLCDWSRLDAWFPFTGYFGIIPLLLSTTGVSAYISMPGLVGVVGWGYIVTASSNGLLLIGTLIILLSFRYCARGAYSTL